MEILSYLQIFASFWCSALLTFASGLITYRQFALIVAVLSALAMAWIIFRRSWKIKQSTLIIFAIYSCIIILYYITPVFYGGMSNDKYRGFFLALAGQVFPAALTASFVASSYMTQEKIKKLAPVVSIVFSFLAIYAVLFPTSMTTGGYTDNENGLNYQSAAYLAAYASALAEYFLISNNISNQLNIMKSKLMTVFVAFTIFVDFIALLLAGGRGGFVAFVLIFLFTTYLGLIKGKLTPQGVAKLILGFTLIIVTVNLGIRFASNSDLQTSGFDRILQMVQYGANDKNRSRARLMAFEIFMDSPIIGHGLGSIFYELGAYSHNCFTDVIAEMGIVGFVVFVAIIVSTIRKGIKMSKKNLSDSLWLYFFLCGFIMSLFSGYYLTHIPMYWGIAFILSFNFQLSRSYLNEVQ